MKQVVSCYWVEFPKGVSASGKSVAGRVCIIIVHGGSKGVTWGSGQVEIPEFNKIINKSHHFCGIYLGFRAQCLL